MEIEQEIRAFLVGTLKVASAPGDLGADDSLIEDHGVDSAGLFELILWLEDRYSLHVPPADMDLRNFSTVGAVAAYVRRRAAVAPGPEVLPS